MANLDNVIRFTQEVAAEFPEMDAAEQVRIATERAEQYEASGQDTKPSRSPGAGGDGPSIREIIEPEFIDNGYSITIDRHDFQAQHGVSLTYQSLRSALRKYIGDNHRLVIRETEDEFTVTRVVRQASVEEFSTAVNGAIGIERARICGEIDELLGDSFRDRALLKALKIIVNQGK